MSHVGDCKHRGETSASQISGIGFRFNKTTIGPQLYIIHINIVPSCITLEQGYGYQ